MQIPPSKTAAHLCGFSSITISLGSSSTGSRVIVVILHYNDCCLFASSYVACSRDAGSSWLCALKCVYGWAGSQDRGKGQHIHLLPKVALVGNAAKINWNGMLYKYAVALNAVCTSGMLHEVVHEGFLAPPFLLEPSDLCHVSTF